ncbi:MAG: TonB-dependent receptor [Bacteroidales bacterium]|nr:TonB-dependent receptor [Bacteroidales bacterium]MBK7626832.1 TonB-dependent receptor [Bacteroidales bacterium]
MMNHFKRMFTMLIFLCISVMVFGQASTTSGINGKIVDPAGKALAGATVLAVHVPSGSQYGALANGEGFFSIQGMRPGGPYTIEISFIGYSKKTINDISLLLGESFVLNTGLEESSTQLSEVVVVGAKAPVFNSEKNGTSINISNRQLTAMPTINRSINDLTRLTPQSNGNQIGGGNYRQNFITVDGAQFNNAFGIGTNLPGNGAPISLDAIDQISVNITPYDVRQSGFIGASVNAVTRSGSNEFSGSVYTYMQNEKYKGNFVAGDKFTRTQSDYSMMGVRLGGPIIKNKLFFFLNYEQEKTTVPGPSRVAATPEAPADFKNIARPTAANLQMISDYLRDNYGYETGPYQGYSFESPGLKFLARVDWNINKNHKLNVRYSYHESKVPSNPSTSVSPFGSLYTGNRQSMDAMWFKNSGYFQERNFTSLSAELNSSLLGGKFMNTLRTTYSFQDEPRSTVGKTFPFVDILDAGRPYTSFGTELFSYGNLREVGTITITDDVTWSMGINNFTAGLEYEHDNTRNGFQRFGTSFYVFNSWNDFVSGARPKDFGITFSNSPGYAQAFPTFKYAQISGYLQDEIIVSSKLKIVAGIRLDLPSYPEPLPEHPIISTLDFNGQTFNSSQLPKTSVMVSPRLGFNYDISEDRSLVLRGGTGIFTGRIPFVWIVSQAGDAGMIQTTQNYSGAAVPAYVTGFNPDPRAYLPDPQPAAGTIIPGTFTILSENFKMPQTWKTSAALDAKLPWGLKGTVEGIFNKDINTAFFENPGLKDPSNLNIAGYPDNRLIYPNANVDRYYVLHTAGVPSPTGTSGVNPILLVNKKGGYYWSATAKLEKAFSNGFAGMIAYTHSEARNLVDGSGDQPSSAWTGNANVNGANSAELSYTSYINPNKIIANLSYRFDYLEHMATSISFFYEGASSGRFSYTYSNNILRDGAGSNNLIYIPRDNSEITLVNQTVNGFVWTADAQMDALFNYINQDKYLSSHKGQYAERNGAVMPWRNSIDLKLMQDFYIDVAGKRNTIQISLDILNFANLLNNKWGIAQSYNQGNILAQTNTSSIVPGGTVRPTFRLNPYNNTMLTKTFSNNISYASTYSMQLGIRYIFN